MCQSLKFLVAGICDLSDVINCQFHEFAISPLEPMHFLLLDQQSGIYCLIICRIQLLTLNSISALRNFVLYKSTFAYLLTLPLTNLLLLNYTGEVVVRQLDSVNLLFLVISEESLTSLVLLSHCIQLLRMV